MRTEAQGKTVKILEVLAKTQTGNGTVSSGWVSRDGFDSARVFASIEAPTGSPSALTATLIVEDATDGSGTSSATFATVSTATDVLAGGIVEGPVNLRLANEFIRVSSVLAFTGGSTPAAISAVGVAATGATVTPVA